MKMELRLETEKDYRTVEEITREAFWNLYVPGCDEHLLVHKIRTHPDFIPELDFVAELNGQVVGNIMYSHSKVIDEHGHEHGVITFGPVSVLPAFQKQGIGAALIKHSAKIAAEMGFCAIVIYGFPEYYHKLGFKSASEFGISRADGKFAKALMAMELTEHAFDHVSGRFFESTTFVLDQAEVALFDQGFPHKEKFRTKTQEQFEITSNALE